MAKPWEKYQTESASDIAKPWEKYGKSAQVVPASPSSATAYDPTQDMSFGEKLAAGAGRSISETGRGMSQLARQIIGEKSATALGLPTQADIEEARKLDQPLMETGAGMAGNVLGQIGQMLAGGAALKAGGAAIANVAPKLGTALEYVGGGLAAPATAKQAASGAAAYTATQPVVGDESRLRNTAIGAAAGAAGAALAGHIAGKLGAKFGNIKNPVPAEKAAEIADREINQSLTDIGQSAADLPNGYIDSLKSQMAQSLSEGKRLDPVAMLRKADFDALGISPTQGQVMRDPMQYALERNLRGVAGVGEPITNRLVDQETALRKGIGEYAQGAVEPQQAGSKIADDLAAIDKSMQGNVSQAYRSARESGQGGAELNLTGLAQDYARIAKEYGGNLPSGVRNVLDDYGLMSGKQMKVMTIDDAENILKVINKNVSNDPAVNSALGEMRKSVKDAVMEGIGSGGGPYAEARKLAADRFALQEAIPALAKAAQGELNPDVFVKNYLVSPTKSTAEVNRLASLLKEKSPESFDLARSQIGDYLQSAAFGENVTGDAPFRAAAYAKALNNLGTGKLKAFFSPDEIAQMRTISRVGSYIHSHPNAAAVSTSNSGNPVVNTMIGLASSKIPGAHFIAGITKAAKQSAQQKAAVESALSGSPKAELLPKGFDEETLNRARLIGGLIGGASAASAGQ